MNKKNVKKNCYYCSCSFNRYIVTGWLYNDDYMIHGAKDDLLTSDDVVKRGDVTHFENCGR